MLEARIPRFANDATLEAARLELALTHPHVRPDPHDGRVCMSATSSVVRNDTGLVLSVLGAVSFCHFLNALIQSLLPILRQFGQLA